MPLHIINKAKPPHTSRELPCVGILLLIGVISHYEDKRNAAENKA